MTPTLVHLHDEQFDGHLHAACGGLDTSAPSSRVVGEDDFEATPRARRCRHCARLWWPRGGEPDR